MQHGWRRSATKIAAIVTVTATTVIGAAPPAHASLLGGLVGTVTGTVTTVTGTTTGLVGGLLGVVTAGWDDGVTTAPTTMNQVAAAIGADQMWSRGYTGSGVGVALIDSGVAPVDGLTAPGKVVDGPDLSFESQDAQAIHLDTYGHGTHMAGIIAGNDAPSTGSFKGVAPGAHIVSLKTASHDGAVDVSQVVAAINWATQHKDDPGMNIRVINLSFGTDGLQSYQLDPITYAVEAAWRKGIVVVVAGGNDGSTRSSLNNPATDPYVLAVGAADLQGTTSVTDDKVAPFSSRGSAYRSVDLLAPGVSIASLRDPGSDIDDAHPSAVVDTRFFRGSGTSQAAAVTSGAVALLLSARPTLTPDKVKALLRSTADPLLGADTRSQGAGRLDVNTASIAAVPFTYAQGWTKATGLGSLEQARGTSHVAMDGIELTGEQDIMGSPWTPATWTMAVATGTAWTGGSWNGVDWTGTCLCAMDWAGASWTGETWDGKSWTGKSWTGDVWDGKSWTGKSWTGGTWDGKSWTGKSWTGKSWTSS